MSEKPYYHQDERAHLRSWVLGQMLVGAGKAAIVLVALLVLLYAIYAVGLLLPEESKQAPSPYSQGDGVAPVTGLRAIV